MPKARTFKAFAVGSVAAVVLAIVPVAAANAATLRTDAVAVDQQYGGEELLRAIVFGDLSQTPTLVGEVPSTPQSAEAEIVIDGLIEQIAETDPLFFDAFASKLQSGDVLQVQEALDDSGLALSDALVDGGYATEGELVSPQWAAIAVVVFAVGAVVVAGAAVLVVSVVSVNGQVATNFQVKNSSGRSVPGSLSQEKMIAELTLALS